MTRQQPKRTTAGLSATRPSSRKAAAMRALADDRETVRITVDVDKAKHTKLKMLAASQSRSISELLRDYIDGIVK